MPRACLALVLVASLSLGLAAAPAAGARRTSGTSSLLAWGYNAYGDLGVGTFTGPQKCQGLACSETPVKVKLPTGTTVTAVAASGADHSLAVTSTGQVLAWGANGSGELGDGSTKNRDLPVKVKLPAGTKVTAVAAGTAGFSLALTSTGQVLAWGYNYDGELGDGTFTGPQKCGGFPCSKTPVKVKLPAGTKVKAIAAGLSQGLALTSTGQVLAWGYNHDGQLGDGSTTSSDVPVAVTLPTGTKVTAIAGGGRHSLAVTSSGQVLAWGYNGFGELGDGSTTSSHVPVTVNLPSGTQATRVAAGGYHSLALTSTGAVLAWGQNAYGQLGDGSTTSSDVPVMVNLPAGTQATRVAADASAGLAVSSTGQVLAWGDNTDGELGDGSTTQSDVPVKVSLPTGTKASAVAAADSFHSLALVHHT